MDSAEEWSLVSSVKHSNRPITLVSSVGGFSQPAVEGIRTLHDLLQSIQHLKLQRYEGAQLQETRFLGEGVSYNVNESTDVKSGSLVAVKKVKLPPAPANLTAFRSRISCILKDIEVMSHLPLAQHPNILNILGYGWESRGEGPLPFIVTECATLGTLREYLTKSTIDANGRRELCCQVASGLNELHLSGVAHGDLKLENVLVVLAAADQVGPRKVPVLAKLSDFGHSLRFASGTNPSQQTYHGTLWYNPPEVVQNDTTVADVRPRKCDAWALGLLYWEVHKRGARYYDDESMRELLLKTEPQSTSINSNSDGPRSLDQESANVLCKKLFNIGSLIVKEAQSWVDRVLAKDPEWPHFDRILLKGVFKNTLAVDPSSRLDVVARLPLVHGNSELRERSLLMAQRAGEAEWTFTLFLEENVSQIPMRVKVEMLEDFQRLASFPQGSPEASARAALHFVFAHVVSFGNIALFTESVGHWIQKSAEGGLLITILMKELLTATLEEKNPLFKHEGPDDYNTAIYSTIRTLARSELPTLTGIGPHSTFATLLNAVLSAGDQSLVAHYAVLCQLTGVLPAEYVNIRSFKTGETALSLACRLGDHKAAKSLLDLGAKPSIYTADGCSALHWLFVFEKIHMRELAVRLQYFDAFNKVADRPQVLDAQLPVDFHGTPLEFALAAASTSAVEVFIFYSQVGVYHPFQGLDSKPSRFSGATLRGAIYQAASLYLYEILAELLQNYLPFISSFIELGDLAKSSYVTKRLIHGHNISTARDATLEQLLSTLKSQFGTGYETGHVLMKQVVSGLQSAIEAGDVPLAQAIMRTVTGITTDDEFHMDLRTVTTPVVDRRFTNEFRPVKLSYRPQQAMVDSSSIWTSEVPFQAEQINAAYLNIGSTISLMCAEVACSLIYDLDTSFEILRFSTYYGPKLGYMDTWLVSTMTAAQQHREDIFCWLLQNPNNLNARNNEGATIIHTMLKHKFTRLVPLDLILSKGANPDLPNELNNTPVHVTIQLGMAQELGTLLDYKASISSRDRDGNTILKAAVKNGRLNVVSRLLQHPRIKTQINERDSEGMSPLALAALLGFSEVAKQLMNAGADPGILNQAGRALIHLAALGSTSGHQLMLALLLSTEQDMNSLDNGGNTALHVSIAFQARLENPTFDACNQLLAAGVDPQIRNNDGDLPIFLALRLLNLKFFSQLLPILLRNGADINARDSLSLSALHVAALYGEVDLVQALIQHGALPDLSGNSDHGTPLHCCAEVYPTTVEGEHARLTTFAWKAFSGVRRKEATVRCLINAGIDNLARSSSPNAHKSGATPLDIALKVGVATIAILLIEEHHTRLSDRLGALHFATLQRAFDYAVKHQQIKIVHQFLLSKIPVDKSSLYDFGHGMKILAHAVYFGKYEILQCYKSTQTKMVVLDRMPQHTSSLEHIGNIPSLWAIIRTSGSRVMEAEVYLQIYSSTAKVSIDEALQKSITIGLNLELMVSERYCPTNWSQEPLGKDLSTCYFAMSQERLGKDLSLFYFANGYPKTYLDLVPYAWDISRWKDSISLLDGGYLDKVVEWLPNLGQDMASSILEWQASGLLSLRNKRIRPTS